MCVFHDPENVENGRRARRAGGINGGRRSIVMPPSTPDHPVSTTKDDVARRSKSDRGTMGTNWQQLQPRAPDFHIQIG